MRKIIQTIALAALCLNFSPEARSQNQPQVQKNQSIIGKVISATTGEALPGAIIKVTSTNHNTVSNDKGEFSLSLPDGHYNLSVYYLSYKTKNVRLQIPLKEPLIITLETDDNNLQEVEIVSTGYQNIPKERATGSYTLIDNTLLNRSVGTNILDRLDGITSGLAFNKNKSQISQSDFNIRGRTTIMGEDRPLIILDNFPHEGDINNINPNDIKNISVLKDAAAASIWGTRAGNGVIVITTFKGAYSSTQTFNFNSNITISGKPDLKSIPWFSSAEWIELEQFLFSKGAYTSIINNGYENISNAVYIMDQRKKGNISFADSLRQINELKQFDVRDQMLEHLNRTSVNQQYALNVSGGGTKNKYFVSTGYDKNLSGKIADSYSRFTLSANNSYRLLNDKIEITSGLSFTNSRSGTNTSAYSPTSPYDRIHDSGLGALPIGNQLRIAYLDTAGSGKLLDWHYRPLDEMYPNSAINLAGYTLNAGISYQILKSLRASVLYLYQNQLTTSEVSNAEDSFFVRNLINQYSTVNNTTGIVTRVLPMGAIIDDSKSQLTSKYGRFQLDFNRSFSERHQITSILGAEVRNNFIEQTAQRYYGFNKDTYINANSAINFTKDYPHYFNPSITSRLSSNQTSAYQSDRYISYYANLSYAFLNRYTFYASARKDESNLFGVESNKKGVPLWSVGLSWEISREAKYNVRWLEYLKLRASYGYSGNVSKSISAYLTAMAVGTNLYGANNYNVVNPPNPTLKWERTRIVNVGLDFGSLKNRISGSIEPYLKYGLDLFGESPLAPQTGVASYRGNTANTFTKGIDIIVNTINIEGTVGWRSQLLLSMNKDKVTKYHVAKGTNSIVVSQPYDNPLEGNPYFSIYGYRWAALDSNGDPTVYFDGKPSKAYSNISASTNRANIELAGSTVPVTYGSLRNSISYKSLAVSFNLTYRLDYYFRRSSLDNGTIYTTKGFVNKTDFNLRWQKPGDENSTSVPALLYPNQSQRTAVYTNSNILIERADNIRFQDVRLDYNFENAKWLRYARFNLQVYCYINNIGYLWTANKYNLDPDFPNPGINSLTLPKTFSFGIKAGF